MAATVHGSARFGCTADASATGLVLDSFATAYSVQIVYAKNHIGNDVGAAFFNDSSEVTCSGVVAVKGTGIVPLLGAALTLANASADGLYSNYRTLFSTPVAGSGLMVSSATLKRTNADFETGEITGIYKPFIATNAPSTVT